MSDTFDLLVAGAGPAGAHAAIAAAEHGLRVAIVDEADAAGGQIHRLPRARRGPGDATPPSEGDDLRTRLARSGAVIYFGRRIWSASAGFRLDLAGPRGHEQLSAPYLVAATGAHERIIPFPGWTLPGVMGLAAATVLMKSEGMLPGRRVAVVGCGPLLPAVAAGILAGGGTVVAVIDLASRREWAGAAWHLLGDRALLLEGLAWVRALRRARVPILSRHGVRRAEGERAVRRLVVGPVGASGAPAPGRDIELDVDGVVVGHGLVPSGDIPRLLGASMAFDNGGGGWCPVTDAHGETSVPRLYAVGDGARIRGGRIAPLAGRIAGLAVAREIGMLPPARCEALMARDRATITRLEPAAARMAAMMQLRPGQVGGISPGTIVCRCEDVTRGDLDAAIRAGARDLNQLKHDTRCGMGPCQGRMCGEAAAEIMAARLGRSRAEVGFWTPRPPLRPVGLESLVGTFSYADIPIPRPSLL